MTATSLLWEYHGSFRAPHPGYCATDQRVLASKQINIPTVVCILPGQALAVH